MPVEHLPEVPRRLWRATSWGLVLALVAVAGLATGLTLGLADPPRAGPLVWEIDFKTGADDWVFYPSPGGRLEPLNGALVAEFAAHGRDELAVGVTPAPTGDFTLEAAGSAAGAGNAAAYGLVFGWQDARHYSAVLVNGDGYAQAYQQDGQARTDWFVWQQWPHILAGPESNRVRVDISGRRVTMRINDELLAEVEAEPAAGQMGVAARTSAPGRVIFSWVRLWARVGQ